MVDFKRMGTQRDEFKAATEFSVKANALSQTAIVDDDFPQVKHEYERALRGLITAMTANGRFSAGSDLAPFAHSVIPERVIDDKHSARVIDGKVEIVKVTNGTTIPPEEPMILFRGRDRLALPMIDFYHQQCAKDGCNEYQLQPLIGRANLFAQFAAEYPERMKQPGITRGL